MEQDELLSFLKTLPLEVALVAYDILKGRVDETTQFIADSSDSFYDYDLLGAVVGGNQENKEALLEYLSELVAEMFQKYKEQEGMK
jgi:hypothetical protein